MTQYLILVLAVILLGTRLPSYMNRLGMSKTDKIMFVIMAFLVLGLAWLAVYVIGRLI